MDRTFKDAERRIAKALARTKEPEFVLAVTEAHKSGRYPLEVASVLLAQAAGLGVSADKMKERLMLAAADGSLPVYLLGQYVRWDGEGMPLADSFLEIYEKDLNAWLAAKEPEIVSPFPVHTPARDVFADDDDETEGDPTLAAYGLIGWYNGSLDAASWWRIANIKHDEAARLLCQSNPHDQESDPLNTTTTETKPVDYKNLLREFEDVASDAQARTLRQWRDTAKERGLKYHSWIDEYERAVRLVQEDQQKDQKDAYERRKAGRRTLDEVITELASQSGEKKKLWRGRILAQLETGALRLKNPKDYDDTNPQAIPQTGNSYDQVSVNDVNTWLAAHPELGGFRLDDAVPATPVGERSQPSAKPLQRQVSQGLEILRVIGELGYTASALPKPLPGKRGIKAAVREKLLPVGRDSQLPGEAMSSSTHMTTRTFDKAWERLLAQRDIQYAA